MSTTKKYLFEVEVPNVSGRDSLMGEPPMTPALGLVIFLQLLQIICGLIQAIVAILVRLGVSVSTEVGGLP
jgi:hypothetical protein